MVSSTALEVVISQLSHTFPNPVRLALHSPIIYSVPGQLVPVLPRVGVDHRPLAAPLCPLLTFFQDLCCLPPVYS